MASSMGGRRLFCTHDGKPNGRSFPFFFGM
jgi:hypothetical protein